MLTNSEIKKQMQNGNIVIENLSNNSLNKPNSCELRIGHTLYVFEQDFIDTKIQNEYLNEVLNDKPNSLKKIQIPEEGLLLEPNRLYLARTIEKVTTHGYIPAMFGKTNLSLLGVSTELTNGIKTDNYNNYLLLTIIATKPTIIYPDLKIANLVFFPSLDTPNFTREINSQKSCGVYSSGMLSGSEIQKRMQQANPDIIIEPQDKIVINPNSVNLTLNDTVGVYIDSVLDLKKENKIRKTQIPDEGMWLYPDEIYLARTNEWTETYNLIPMMSGRSSLGRNGLFVHCSAGMGSIGYKGFWHLGIRTIKPIRIMKDMKTCQIYYLTADGEILDTYHGYFQNLPGDEISSQLHRSLVKKKKN